MAVEIPVFQKTFKAGGTIAAYTFVKMSAAETVIACAGATDRPIGVAQDAAVSGGMVSVMIMGETKISADAAIAVGVLIGTSADAQADAKTPGTDTTEYICGQVTVASGAAADLLSAVINCANISRGA